VSVCSVLVISELCRVKRSYLPLCFVDATEVQSGIVGEAVFVKFATLYNLWKIYRLIYFHFPACEEAKSSHRKYPRNTAYQVKQG
jgi:hypothetical protein